MPRSWTTVRAGRYRQGHSAGMLVNGKPAESSCDKATQYLRDALNPFRVRTCAGMPRGGRVVSGVAVRRCGSWRPHSVRLRLSVRRRASAASEVRRLETHLRQGGGVVFCLGPHVDLEAYNRLLYRNGDGMLPARLTARAARRRGDLHLLRRREDPRRRRWTDSRATRIARSLPGSRYPSICRVELPARRRARCCRSCPSHEN